jgi:C4-dicarboxylate-binding protein DctP
MGRSPIAVLRTLALAILLTLGVMPEGARAEGANRPLLRISTENAADHVQTRFVADFAQALRDRLGDRLEVVHESAAVLFRDRDVIHALRQGQVEMAVPGTWQIDRFVPPIGAFLLPAFYGLDKASTHALRDGAAGAAVTRAIEAQLDVVVPGRWLDLGFTHIYTRTIAVKTHDDLKGLVIRTAGGDANAARLRALGMMPVVVPWPDLPAALKSGKLDGVLTSHESAASARLWEHGLTHVFEDRQYFAQYVPLIAARFWNRLPADMRAILRATWEDHVDDARAAAEAAQAAARITLVEHGMQIITPDDATLRAHRREIGADLGADLEKLGVSAELAQDIFNTLARTSGDLPR